MIKQLSDTSAWIAAKSYGIKKLKEAFDQQLLSGSLAVCDVVKFELLYSPPNPSQFIKLRTYLEELENIPISSLAWKRALEVYQELAERGGAHQRQVKQNDLLIAATAEIAGLEVLHYDQDFDRIAKITGQPTRWLAPKGSIKSARKR